MQERLHSVLYAVLTRVCAASGERGFPSSHTTWSATNSTTPAATMLNFLIILLRKFKHVKCRGDYEPLFRRTGSPCLRRKGSISCVNCSRGPSLSSTWGIVNFVKQIIRETKNGIDIKKNNTWDIKKNKFTLSVCVWYYIIINTLTPTTQTS